jgi:hypothetical protein
LFAEKNDDKNMAVEKNQIYYIRSKKFQIFLLVFSVKFFEVYEEKRKQVEKRFLFHKIGNKKVIGYTFSIVYTYRANCRERQTT